MCLARFGLGDSMARGFFRAAAVLACLTALARTALAGQPAEGVLYQCDYGNQLRITRCNEKFCETELGPPSKLAPYFTLSPAGVEDLLRRQSCVDPQGKRAVPDAPERAPANAGAPAAHTAPGSACRVDGPSPRRLGGSRNAVLSVAGAGFTYTSETRNRKTDVVTSSQSERGNFAGTTFYLLDEDADQILRRAGVEPGMLGSRFAMLVFTEGFGGAADDAGIDSIIGLFGPEQQRMMDSWVREPGREAQAEFDCLMKTIRAHAVAEVTTDEQARGVFPAVPAGVYYLFGRFHHQGLRGAIWNLRREIPPGRSQATVSIGNAVWVGAKRD